jgi:hypothetical protein
MSPTNNGARARFSGCYSGILVKREFGCREYVGSLCVIRDRARHKGESAVHGISQCVRGEVMVWHAAGKD